MQVAVLTFDGFNELDSFVAAAILNRLRPHGWAAHITAPTETVTSMNGVVVHRQRPLAFVEEADAVLIDAPCSGTGTWRRNPEARWRLTDGSLAKLCVTQRELLAFGARLLKPGGRLIYVVCSLLDEEGADQFDRFLADNPNFESQALSLPLGAPRKRGIRLTPYRDGTDGFFIACARQP